MPSLTPRYLNRYRQITEVLISHGFGAVLAQLGLDRRLNLPRRLLRRQPPVESDKSAAKHVRLALEELGPTFVKFGQILSTRPDLLPPSFLAELSKLQDDVPPAPWPEIKASIESELGGKIDELFIDFDPTPIAAASLAQVHGAKLPSGEQVVVKVQRPNIEQTINLDLDILYDLARLAQERLGWGEYYDLTGLAEEFSVALKAELDYRREGYNADRFRENFAEDPSLYIPKIYWNYTTNRVLVQERIFGIKVDNIEAMDEAGYDRHKIALNSARLIVKEILEDGFFHADPHPGNIVVLPGEVIGMMDFGTVGYLEPRDRVSLIRLYILAVQLDTEGLVDQFVQMGIADYNQDRLGLQRDLRRLLLKYHGVPLQDVRAGEIIDEIRPVIYRYHLRLPSNLWLLGKTLVIMEGVGLKLDPDFDIFSVSEPYVKKFLRNMWMPSSWGPSVLRNATAWGDLLNDLPRQANQIIKKTEQGDLTVQIELPQLEPALNRADKIATRVILSLLLAAFILGLAMLIPGQNLESWPWSFVTWVIVIGFLAASFIGVWLIVSIIRSGGKL